MFSSQGKEASKPAGNWFQLSMVLFTKECLPRSVLCFLVLIFDYVRVLLIKTCFIQKFLFFLWDMVVLYRSSCSSCGIWLFYTEVPVLPVGYGCFIQMFLFFLWDMVILYRSSCSSCGIWLFYTEVPVLPVGCGCFLVSIAVCRLVAEGGG